MKLVLAVICIGFGFQAHAQQDDSPVNIILDGSNAKAALRATSETEVAGREAEQLSRQLEALDKASADYAAASERLVASSAMGNAYSVVEGYSAVRDSRYISMKIRAKELTEAKYPHLEAQPGFRENLLNYLDKQADHTSASLDVTHRSIYARPGERDPWLDKAVKKAFDSLKNAATSRSELTTKYLVPPLEKFNAEKAMALAAKNSKVMKVAVPGAIAAGLVGAYAAFKAAQTPVDARVDSQDAGLVASLHNAAGATQTDNSPGAQAQRE